MYIQHLTYSDFRSSSLIPFIILLGRELVFVSMLFTFFVSLFLSLSYLSTIFQLEVFSGSESLISKWHQIYFVCLNHIQYGAACIISSLVCSF